VAKTVMAAAWQMTTGRVSIFDADQFKGAAFKKELTDMIA